MGERFIGERKKGGAALALATALERNETFGSSSFYFSLNLTISFFSWTRQKNFYFYRRLICEVRIAIGLKKENSKILKVSCTRGEPCSCCFATVLLLC